MRLISQSRDLSLGIFADDEPPQAVFVEVRKSLGQLADDGRNHQIRQPDDRGHLLQFAEQNRAGADQRVLGALQFNSDEQRFGSRSLASLHATVGGSQGFQLDFDDFFQYLHAALRGQRGIELFADRGEHVEAVLDVTEFLLAHDLGGCGPFQAELSFDDDVLHEAGVEVAGVTGKHFWIVRIEPWIRIQTGLQCVAPRRLNSGDCPPQHGVVEFGDANHPVERPGIISGLLSRRRRGNHFARGWYLIRRRLGCGSLECCRLNRGRIRGFVLWNRQGSCNRGAGIRLLLHTGRRLLHVRLLLGIRRLWRHVGLRRRCVLRRCWQVPRRLLRVGWVWVPLRKRLVFRAIGLVRLGIGTLRRGW